jgi:GxxExxY protein
MGRVVKRSDLLFPELSYEIVGCVYSVHNELGAGHPEAVYQKAFTVALRNKNIGFREQAHFPLTFQGEVVGRGFVDFLIEESIVVELKKSNHFSKSNIDQVYKYLIWGNKHLGIIINFGIGGVKFKRVVHQPLDDNAPR